MKLVEQQPKPETPLEQFFASRTPMQLRVFSEIRAEYLQREKQQTGSTGELFVDRLTFLLAASESVAVDQKEKPGSTVWNALVDSEHWLLPAVEYRFLVDKVQQFEQYVGKQKQLGMPRSFTTEEYLSFSTMLVSHFHGQEGEKEPSAALFSLVKLCISSSWDNIRRAFGKRQARVYSRGLVYQDKAKRKDEHLLAARVLNDFVDMTLEAVADDESPHHQSAQNLLTHIAVTNDGTYGIAPERVHRAWLGSLFSLAMERNISWYSQLAQEMVYSIQSSQHDRYLFASELEQIVGVDQKKSDVRMGRFVQLVELFSQQVGNRATVSPGDIGHTAWGAECISGTVHLRKQLYEAECRLVFAKDADKQKTKTLGFYVYWRNLLQPVVLFDVIDPENVPHMIRSIAIDRLGTILSAVVSRTIDAKKQQQMMSAPLKPVTIPSLPQTSRGPTRTPPKETKREKRTPTEVFVDALTPQQEEAGIFPQLAQDELQKARTQVTTDFDTWIANGIARDITQYQQERLGKFKVYKYHLGPHDGHIFSLRSGDYRVLFEVREKNQLAFLFCVHRKNLWKVLDKLQQKR